MIIKQAKLDEYSAVRAFYHSLIDALPDSSYVKWKKDIYPAPDYLESTISRGKLYFGIENNSIIAAMVLNHDCNESYKKFQWPTEAKPDEIMVIHALGVHPLQSGKGYAKEMVKFAIEKARTEQQKALRLDVFKGNVPAEKLYAGLGFQYLHTLQMLYEDTGWTDFKLYEYKIL